jgi:hypothetical protein
MSVCFSRLLVLVPLAVLALPLETQAQTMSGPPRDTSDSFVASGLARPPVSVDEGRRTYSAHISLPAIEANRTEFAEQARRRQGEVSRILAEESLAKARGAATDARGLTTREERLLSELGREDREVRTHELTHFYTGRPYTAEPEYWFVTGPLGKRFAVAGHVRFDLAPVAGDLKATLKKYEVLRRAARAPTVPSSYDLRVAAELDRSIAKMRQQISDAR